MSCDNTVTVKIQKTMDYIFTQFALDGMEERYDNKAVGKVIALINDFD